MMARSIQLILLVAVAAAFGLAPSPAAAAACADHPNQKAAQDAKDTLDGDGDGIFCEALPCPCSQEALDANGGGGTTNTKPNQKAKKSYIYDGRITQVVDGDTLKVKIRNKVRTVRVIGIDTPESHKPNVAPECGSAQATSAAIEWTFDRPIDVDGDGLYDHGRRARKVRLRTDQTQTKTDKYGRLLAYVGRGGSDFGRQQLRKGWADIFVYRNNPFKRYAAYEKTFEAARAAGRGVWSTCGGDFHSNQ